MKKYPTKECLDCGKVTWGPRCRKCANIFKIIPVEKLFWIKVDKTFSCWIWKAFRNKEGYGQFCFKHRMHNANRIAWVLTYGEIPKGMLVCHHCDNPPCVNPSHLFLGTNKDNTLDKMKKGRYQDQSGSRNGNAKLTELQVKEIIEKNRITRDRTSLAKEYGICKGSIDYILGKGWKNLKANAIESLKK